jgi:hypothetical protein
LARAKSPASCALEAPSKARCIRSPSRIAYPNLIALEQRTKDEKGTERDRQGNIHCFAIRYIVGRRDCSVDGRNDYGTSDVNGEDSRFGDAHRENIGGPICQIGSELRKKEQAREKDRDGLNGT